MKPEIVTIAMHSPPPMEYSDPGRPRPPEILERKRLARELLRTRPRATIRFVDPALRRLPRLTLREIEQHQRRVEFDSRFNDRMAQQRAIDHVANQRERRLRPTLSDLHERLRAKLT